MSDWILESDWSKVNVGDRVRVERDGGDCAEFTVADSGMDYLSSKSNNFHSWDGWTLYVAAKPTPALPTEPGIYVCLGGSEWEQIPLFCTPSGNWSFSNGEDANEAAEQWHARIGLVRLESQADTAEKVLAAVMKRPKFGNTYEVHAADVADIAAEFGVSL